MTSERLLVIFTLYPRVVVKLAGESHVFDRARLMYTEVAEIERVTGLSYPEWLDQLGEYRITAVAALLHVLRKREGPSDYGSLQFNVADLDVVPLHDDGREFTAQEVAADLKRRVEEAQKDDGAGPTRAAGAAAVAPEAPSPGTNGISLSSPRPSTSAPGNGNGSPGRTSASARRTSTRN
jgi:hypothetical protein